MDGFAPLVSHAALWDYRLFELSSTDHAAQWVFSGVALHRRPSALYYSVLFESVVLSAVRGPSTALSTANNHADLCKQLLSVSVCMN